MKSVLLLIPILISIKKGENFREIKREEIGFITWSYFHVMASKIPENPT